MQRCELSVQVQGWILRLLRAFQGLDSTWALDFRLGWWELPGMGSELQGIEGLGFTRAQGS